MGMPYMWHDCDDMDIVEFLHELDAPSNERSNHPSDDLDQA